MGKTGNSSQLLVYKSNRTKENEKVKKKNQCKKMPKYLQNTIFHILCKPNSSDKLSWTEMMWYLNDEENAFIGQRKHKISEKDKLAGF